MKFFLDHDVPVEIGRVLARDGHEVSILAHVLPVNATDDQVFNAAQQEDAIV